MKFTVGNVSAENGSKAFGWLDIGRSPDGSMIGVPIMIVNGARDGPKLCVDGCVHGDEYEGTEAILKLVREMDPTELKGTLIAVPVVNVPAFAAGLRANPVDYDRYDINRVFPGNSDGHVSERIAFKHFETISRADFYISLHGGGNFEFLEPFVNFSIDEGLPATLVNQSMELAKAFGLRIVNRRPGSFAGTARLAAARRGIPSITPELGGQCERADRRQVNVDLFVKGINNVMKYLSMMEGELEKPKSQVLVETTEVRCENGGLQIPMVRPGGRVSKGDPLVKILTPFFGDEIECVKAPFDGLVCLMWAYPIVQPGDWVTHLGRVIRVL
ncbi:MAG: succinylglutamate desuccinylase/aspartoacylase family protein [Candidatus Bathyarchaeia archaeon]